MAIGAIGWRGKSARPSVPAENAIRLAVVEAFFDAWNRHDIDGLMACVTEDCVFETAIGPEPCGTRHVGSAAVRQAFVQAWRTITDARWEIVRHLPCGNVIVSEWIFAGTQPDGSAVRANGCDILSFRGEKIAVKNAFRKQRTV
jgi:ketosteroid isomerase-like protein